VYNVAIYRIKYKTPAAPKPAAKSARGGKNAASEDAAGQAGQQKLVLTRLPAGDSDASATSAARLSFTSPATCSLSPSQSQPQQTEKKSCSVREFEYVNIPKLYLALRNVFAGFCPSYKRHLLHSHHYMLVLAVLICLGGTDFSRGLPYIGPSTLWGMLSEREVFTSLLDAYDPCKGLMDA
jgi:hypothetical protein